MTNSPTMTLTTPTTGADDHVLGYYWRDRARPIRAAVAILVKRHGGTVAHTSDSGSVYIDLPSCDSWDRPTTMRVRVSDHELPSTPARAYANAQGNRAAAVAVIVGEEWRWAKRQIGADTVLHQIAFAVECAEG